MLDCVACKEKRNKLTYLTCFYVILYDFKSCSAFLDVKQTLHYILAIEVVCFACVWDS